MLYTLIAAYDKLRASQSQLLDYMQLVLFALYIWTWLSFQFTCLYRLLLAFIITYIPNSMIYVRKCPVDISAAATKNGIKIDQKLKLYISHYWENGHVDMDNFAKYMGQPDHIWLTYYPNCSVGDTSSEPKTCSADSGSKTCSADSGSKTCSADSLCQKLMLIDFNKKAYAVTLFSPHGSSTQKTDILFGTVYFE